MDSALEDFTSNRMRLKIHFNYDVKCCKHLYRGMRDVPIQEETKGVRKKGMLNGDPLIHREGKGLRYENP